MRCTTRARMVVLTLIPCLAAVGLFIGLYSVRRKAEVHQDIKDKTSLLAGQVTLQLQEISPDQAEAVLRQHCKSFGWVDCISWIDSYGRVLASDGSARGQQWIVGLEAETRRDILSSVEPIYLEEVSEFYIPFSTRNGRTLLRIGLTSQFVQGRIWGLLRWSISLWAATGIGALLAALFFSRVSLQSSVASLATTVDRVADGRDPESLVISIREPAFSSLVKSLSNLFRAFQRHRMEIQDLQTDLRNAHSRLRQSKAASEADLHERDTQIRSLREELAILKKHVESGIVKVYQRSETIETNPLARRWLSLGPRAEKSDLPQGLLTLLQNLRESGTPVQGEFACNRSYLGPRRELSALCVPLHESNREGMVAEVILTCLEKESASESKPFYDRAAYLSLLHGRMIYLGREIHNAFLTEGPAERRRRHGEILNDLASLIRDADTMAAFDRGIQPTHGEDMEFVTDRDLPSLIEEAAEAAEIRIYMVGAELTSDSLRQTNARLLLNRHSAPLLFRETFLALRTGVPASCAEVRLELQDHRALLHVTPHATPESMDFFRSLVKEILQSDGHIEGIPDFLRVRMALIRGILERIGGDLLFQEGTGTLVLISPAEQVSSVEDLDPLVRLARSFFS